MSDEQYLDEDKYGEIYRMIPARGFTINKTECGFQQHNVIAFGVTNAGYFVPMVISGSCLDYEVLDENTRLHTRAP